MKYLILFLLLPINLFSQNFTFNTYEYYEGTDSASIELKETTEDFVEYNLVDSILTEKIFNDTLIYTYQLSFIDEVNNCKRYYAKREDEFICLLVIANDYSEITFGYRKDGVIKIHKYYMYIPLEDTFELNPNII